MTSTLKIGLTDGTASTTFNLPRMQANAHYDINYRPNTNNRFIQVTLR